MIEVIPEVLQDKKPTIARKKAIESDQRVKSSKTVKTSSQTKKAKLHRNSKIQNHRKYDSMRIDQLYTPTSMKINPYNIAAYNSVTVSKEDPLPGPSIVSHTSIFDHISKVEFTSPRARKVD